MPEPRSRCNKTSVRTPGLILCCLWLAVTAGLAAAEDARSTPPDPNSADAQTSEVALASDLELQLGATLVIQQAWGANGGEFGPGQRVGDAGYSLDIVFEKCFGNGSAALLHLETGDSEGVEQWLKVFSNVNYDADNSAGFLQVTECWLSHAMGPITAQAGKIDPTSWLDSNPLANDETTQFLARIFRNSPTIAFPDNALGASLTWIPADFLKLEGMCLDAESDNARALDAPFYAAQTTLSHAWKGLAGHVRMFGWVNQSPHSSWRDLSPGHHGRGWGLNFDQTLTEGLGLFGRYAWQDPEVFPGEAEYSLEHAFSLGLQIGGSWWGRSEDVLGAAWGQVRPSIRYAEAAGLQTRPEIQGELYYLWRLFPFLALSPDLQVILNPFGTHAMLGCQPIIVAGIRSQWDF